MQHTQRDTQGMEQQVLTGSEGDSSDSTAASDDGD